MIHYKKIISERLEDAPFCGALIVACGCNNNCKGCFNQHLKELPTQTSSAEDIIRRVKSNPFNKGIIFGGLEWSLQIDEARELAIEARKQGLTTMLYTGSSFTSIDSPEYFDYIKAGRYIEGDISHTEYGIILASSNQHIYKKGTDY